MAGAQRTSEPLPPPNDWEAYRNRRARLAVAESGWYAPVVFEFLKREPKAWLIVTSILAAVVVTTVSLGFLIHSRIRSEGLVLLLAALAVIVPTAIVVMVFARPAQRAEPESVEPSFEAGWLEIEGDDEMGYTISGDDRALSTLAVACRDLTEATATGAEVELSLPNADVVRIVRQDLRPAVPVAPPPTWKERLDTIGCLASFVAMCAVWFRGCAALETDLQRFLSDSDAGRMPVPVRVTTARRAAAAGRRRA